MNLQIQICILLILAASVAAGYLFIIVFEDVKVNGHKYKKEFTDPKNDIGREPIYERRNN